MDRKIFLLIVTAAFVYVTSPLLFPVAMGGILAVLFYPFLERMHQNRFAPGPGAALLTLAITLVVLVPTAGLIFFGAKSGITQLQIWRAGMSQNANGQDWIGTFAHGPRAQSILRGISYWVPISPEQLMDAAMEFGRSVIGKLTELLGTLVSHLPGMALSIAIMVVSLFFFLVDGRKLVAFARRNSVFSPQQTDHMFNTLAAMCRSVILASLASGCVQALVEFMACLLAGIPNAALIGVIVFFCSFVPVLGAVPVTLGVAIYAFVQGLTGTGISLLIAAALVALLDNLIRPLFLRGAGDLHPLLAFVAAFGGLQMLGVAGVFIGPILAALFVVTLDMIDQTHA